MPITMQHRRKVGPVAKCIAMSAVTASTPGSAGGEGGGGDGGGGEGGRGEGGDEGGGGDGGGGEWRGVAEWRGLTAMLEEDL